MKSVAREDRKNGQDDQRDGHGRRAIVPVLRRVRPGCAEKDDHKEPRHVKGGQKGGEERQAKKTRCCGR